MTADDVARLAADHQTLAHATKALRDRAHELDLRSRQIPRELQQAEDRAARQLVPVSGGAVEQSVFEALETELRQVRRTLAVVVKAIALSEARRAGADLALSQARLAAAWTPVPRPKVVRV